MSYTFTSSSHSEIECLLNLIDLTPVSSFSHIGDPGSWWHAQTALPHIDKMIPENNTTVPSTTNNMITKIGVWWHFCPEKISVMK